LQPGGATAPAEKLSTAKCLILSSALRPSEAIVACGSSANCFRKKLVTQYRAGRRAGFCRVYKKGIQPSTRHDPARAACQEFSLPTIYVGTPWSRKLAILFL
jgi:hypothetical protein